MLTGLRAPAPAPAGTRAVTFHGLTIFVPKSWATNAVKCGAPLRDTVFYGDSSQPACGSIGGSQFSEADLLTWQPGIGDRSLHQRSLTIDGHRATVGSGAADGAYTTELIVPDLRARVRIGSPSPTVGARLVRTAQITRTDANGCPSVMGYLDLTSPPTTGPAGVLVAGRPTDVVICTYGRTYLERGVRLSPADATRLVGVLDALPAGLSVASPKYYLPSLCAKPSTAHDFDYVIRIGYRHGAVSLVYARLSLCGALGFTNGTRTGQRTTPATELLVTLSGIDTPWQGGVQPRS